MVLDFFAPKYGAKRDWLLLWSFVGLLDVLIIIMKLIFLDSMIAASVPAPSAAWSANPLMALVIAPLWEEVAFRSWLVNKKIYLGVGTITAALFLMKFLTGSGFTLAGTISLLMILLALGLFTARFSFQSPFPMSGILIIPGILSMVCFGLIHVFDRPGWEHFSIFIALASVLPQLMKGFFFWVARTRIGLVGAIALHSAVNFGPTMIQFLPGLGIVIWIGILIANVVIIVRSRKWVPVVAVPVSPEVS
jgi:hypothetical protein